MTDYTFYVNTYLLGQEAVLSATSFAFWERKASQEVRLNTFGNINETLTISDAVQMCVCEVAEWLYKQASQDNKGIASEKVGELTVSYQNATATDKQNELRQIITRHLASTGYLYAGVM